jgi:hypothetical protein
VKTYAYMDDINMGLEEVKWGAWTGLIWLSMKQFNKHVCFIYHLCLGKKILYCVQECVKIIEGSMTCNDCCWKWGTQCIIYVK